MRAIAWLLFYGLLGAAGYFGYPYVKDQMFSYLDSDDPYVRKLPLADGGVLRVNLRKLTVDDFPPMVEVKNEVEGRLPDGTATRSFPAGSKLRPVKYFDGRVTLEDTKAAFLAEVSVDETNFAEVTLDNMVARIKATMEAEGVVFATEDFSEEKDETEIAKVEEEKPDGDQDERTELPRGELDDEQIVIAMQQYIEDGHVSEFELEQVEDWTAGEPEEVDGKSAQIGTLTVTSETVFGSTATKEVKAIIIEGRVKRMIWPKSGVQVK